MGVTNSQSKEEIERTKIPIQQPWHLYFTDHTLLINRSSRDTLLRKTLLLPTEEAKRIKQDFEKTQKLPFSLITPDHVVREETSGYCSPYAQLTIYSQWHPRTLEEKIKEDGPLTQAAALFLINELSKSLTLLEERGRAHWGISPSTVFVNSYNNYYIHDSLYVIGPNVKSTPSGNQRIPR